MGCRFWFHHEIDLGLGHSSQKAFSRIENDSSERGVGCDWGTADGTAANED